MDTPALSLSKKIAKLRIGKQQDAGKSGKGRESDLSLTDSKSPPPRPLTLAVRDGTHIATRPTAELLDQIGGRERLVSMTARFYSKMFRDKHLSKFVTDEDDPHAERLGDWIAEKMSGRTYWSSKLASRPVDQPWDRSSAHSKAWHSPRRESERYGSRFKLDDTVIWMRLMFWSCREEGLDTEPFFSWFVSFIAHFSRVYERLAPPYAKDAAKWSADPSNLAKYEKDEWMMDDAAELRKISLSYHYGGAF